MDAERLLQCNAPAGEPLIRLGEFAAQQRAKRIHCHDVCLPTTTHGEIKLRCVTQPDDLQSMLLDRLGITLPKRLRIDETSLPIALSA